MICNSQALILLINAPLQNYQTKYKFHRQISHLLLYFSHVNYIVHLNHPFLLDGQIKPHDRGVPFGFYVSRVLQCVVPAKILFPRLLTVSKKSLTFPSSSTALVYQNAPRSPDSPWAKYTSCTVSHSERWRLLFLSSPNLPQRRDLDCARRPGSSDGSGLRILFLLGVC